MSQPSRRAFLRGVASGALVPALSPRLLDELERCVEPFTRSSLKEIQNDEEYWRLIRAMFPVQQGAINLENGFSSPQARLTAESTVRHMEAINGGVAQYMRRSYAGDLDRVKGELAELAGCSADELVITRNTTESMATVIHGLSWEEGDEAIMTSQDYGTMLEQFQQESRRHGIRCVSIDLPLHPSGDEEVVECYARAVTPRTRAILLTHMINLTGQILPARAIADMAHARGIRVIIDAAHSFAHVVYSVPDLGGDYFGASLHKWLCAPLGAGILQMPRGNVRSLWPLFGETSVPADDIRKFQRIGTHPAWTILAISDAIRFHNIIGGVRKEARLRFLREYWTERVQELNGVILQTPGGRRACAIANVLVRGLSAQELSHILMDKHRIYTVPIDRPAVRGVRITPHVYTTVDELDRLVDAIRSITRA